MRTCIGPCGLILDDSCFRAGRNGSKRNVCRTCSNKQRSPEGKKIQNHIKRNSRINNPAQAIIEDSRKSDKKAGRKNDLDVIFVRDLISHPCVYCGETKLRMTLDRKDNTIGHTKNNVVPCCIRCNYARGNMPYDAWLYLIDGMKKARESGAFGTWIGRLLKFDTRFRNQKVISAGSVQ